jgi:hypothetical protein
MADTKENTIKSGDVTLAAIKDAVKPGTTEDVIQPLELGSIVRLKAAFGRTIHPFTQVEFDLDKSHKVEVDSWINLQYTHGKLVKED